MTRRSPSPGGAAAADDRPPICPACGVTMGMVGADDGSLVFVCLECGFDESDGTAA
jgi:tRNA(Ile2) C34 agmatinyltransferase TiaS